MKGFADSARRISEAFKVDKEMDGTLYKWKVTAFWNVLKKVSQKRKLNTLR